MPIPCLDGILRNSEDQILVGWRLIPAYQGVWALPGGRIYKSESLKAAAKRILMQYDVTFRDLFLVGVFPVKLASRSDLTVCVAGNYLSGTVTPDGREFSSFRWARYPRRMGGNYRRMISRWLAIKRRPQILRFNRLC
jgi:ADP-ribose pyrophosphatase YjhB (NUDIX family)